MQSQQLTPRPDLCIEILPRDTPVSDRDVLLLLHLLTSNEKLMLNSIAGQSPTRVSKLYTVDSWTCYGRAFGLVYSKDNNHCPARSFKYCTGPKRRNIRQGFRPNVPCFRACKFFTHLFVQRCGTMHADARYVRPEQGGQTVLSEPGSL